MPTYQYACTTCGEQLEAVQKFTDAALTVCPTCGGALRKVYSPVGIVFKGSGFYRNDSRAAAKAASSNGSGEGSSSAGAGSGGDSGSSSTDSKSAGAAKSAGGSNSAKPAAGSTSKSSAPAGT